MQTTICFPSKAGTPLMACLALLLILFLAACEKEPQDPAYGLQNITRVKNVDRILDKMTTFPERDDPSYTVSFNGQIKGKAISAQGRASEADPYFASIGEVFMVRSTKPYLDTKEFEFGTKMLLVQIFKHFDDEVDIGVQFRWMFPLPEDARPQNKSEWIDKIMTSTFVPGATIPMLSYGEDRDTSIISTEKPRFDMIMTGSGENFSLEQSDYATEYQSLYCTSFTRQPTSAGIRYIVELDVKHGLAGHSKGANRDFIPMAGNLRINYLFQD